MSPNIKGLISLRRLKYKIDLGDLLLNYLMRIIHLFYPLVNIFQFTAVRQVFNVNRTLIREIRLNHLLHILLFFSVGLVANRYLTCALLNHLFCNGIVNPLFLLVFVLQNSVEMKINQLLVRSQKLVASRGINKLKSFKLLNVIVL